MKRYKKFSLLIITISLGCIMVSCKKLVDVPLPTAQITSEATFNADGTAVAYLTGSYAVIGNNTVGGFLSLSFLTGLSADELRVLDVQSYGIYLSTYKYRLNASGDVATTKPEYWQTLYSLIYSANGAIEGLNKSTALTPAIKKYLLGEAKFMRAYLYFYLLNLYGNIPLALGTDWRINSNLPRANKEDVYNQIIADLKEAKILLPTSYLAGDLKTISSDRVRPTKWAAIAMLSRVYLYTGKNDKDSEDAATELINNRDFSLPELTDVFLRTSPEVIWSIQPTDPSRNTQEAQRLLLNGPPTTNLLKPFYLNPNLINSFEIGDPRKAVWTNSFTSNGITYYGVAKYRALATSGAEQTEYSVLLRLAEVYLNRAEVRARQNNIQGCVDDLNLIRRRARGTGPGTTLPDYSASLSKNEAIAACIKERRFELFSELGHRWFDLKRSGIIDEVMIPAASSKGAIWNNNWSLYPIPKLDIESNPALIGNQNPGYE